MQQHRLRRGLRGIWLVGTLVVLGAAQFISATEHHGQVFFRGAPVPGATVTVKQGDKKFATVTDRQGLYEFPDLADGEWKIEIESSGFAPFDGKLNVAPSAPQGTWELKLLGLDQILTQAQWTKPEVPQATTASSPVPAQGTGKEKGAEVGAAVPPVSAASDEAAEKSSDGLLINGSENNAATSPFSMARAFGNRRPGSKDLYTGGIGAIIDNSIFDARPFSLTGLQIPRDQYSRYTGLLTLGGPLNIPHLIHNGPNFVVAYQWTRSNDASSLSGLVPTAAERSGDLSNVLNAQGQQVTLYNPATGLPFTGSIPVSPQAAALLNLYPLPNLAGNARYNYQTEVVNSTHIDSLQSRMNKTLGRKDQMFGGFGFRSARANSTSLFGFLDGTDTLGIDTNVNWSHRYRHQMFAVVGYHVTRLRTEVRPEFDGRANVSGEDGIRGNDQDSANWGPPGLTFASGIAGLSDANSAFNRNRTDALTLSVSTTYRHHEFTFGGDFRKQEFNEDTEQNPRGTFTFTGAATAAPGSASASAAGQTSGFDFADFLLGIPDTSALAFGNADKYFRQPVYDAFITDDWRLRPTLTINPGVRWDYGAPMTELFGRLVNLDIAQGFSAAAPVLASNPSGPITGTKYPDSLVRPDRHGIEPRIGISWRPVPASTLVIRAGYGIYDDTSVYLSAVQGMAQQAPLSTSVSVANNSTCPLTLADGFRNCAGTTADTFALDPHLRVGYAQDWQLQVQRDLPAAMVVTATYLGTKGTHGMQEFLPNTYPLGAASPCPSCPLGFIYRTSGGNSTREAGTIQLRRRLRSGLAATLEYTYAKALDDDAQVGAPGHTAVTSTTNLTPPTAAPPATVAQNWLNLRGERGLSTFDQRHLFKAQMQYSTGMGLGGGTLLSGWRGRLLKEWTATTEIASGTGLPESPLYVAAVPGTGFTNTIRPDLTGASITQAPPGYFLNDAAYAAPTAGQWGTARRNSIPGPYQFTLDSALARTFRLRNRFNLDLRVDSTNTLNHAAFTAWNTAVNSTTFGLPASANPMRSLQITGRLRF
jgi:hypothetical protein